MNEQRMLLDCAYPRLNLIRPAARRIDGRLLGLCAGLLALLAAAALLYLSQASAAAELRYRLGDLEREQAELYEQVALLRCQTATNDRLANLEARAEELGLVDAPPSHSYVVCYVPTPVALPKQASPRASRPETGPLSAIDSLLARLAARPGPQAMALGLPQR